MDCGGLWPEFFGDLGEAVDNRNSFFSLFSVRSISSFCSSRCSNVSDFYLRLRSDPVSFFFGLAPKLPAFLFCLWILFWNVGDSSWPVIWTERWGITILFFGLYSIWKINYRHWIFPIFLSYVFFGAVWFTFKSEAYAGTVNQILEMLSKTNNTGDLEHQARAFIPILRQAHEDYIVLVLAFVFFLNSKIDLSFPLKLCSWVVFTGILVSNTPQWEVPLMWNPSMAATFVVLGSGSIWLSAIAVVMTHSRTALFSAAALFLFKNVSQTRRTVAIILSTIGVAAFFQLQKGVTSNRTGIWLNYASWWWHSGWKSVLFGTGFGTTKIWLPSLEVFTNQFVDTKIQVWLHNDWLDALTLSGIVGFVLVLFSAWKVFRLADQEDRPMVAAFFVSMISNMPTHWTLTGLVGWSIAKRVLVRNQVVNPDIQLAGSQSSVSDV